ncbi:phage terminase small subunit P27 family [Bacillus licheniformis]|uniref:Phage terminase small subunit P27 family n=1 Tax=Bacillus licheniformis TaxID=1402 RepID=A0AB37GHE1_BACLI|nr:phage terminase small subunit P27 family [Bacillus licheniformis]MED1082824.1 phage terminase small subunit P27 family [Bacillus licheniformis]QPR70543.1 phage terminase small subunit P27 family [Bacillus licheniformis]
MLISFDFKTFFTHKIDSLQQRQVIVMGRKPTLTDATKKHLTKEEIAERKDKEQVLYDMAQIDGENIPSFLDARGKREWQRITPLLEQLPVSELDRGLLSMYCNWYSIFIKASNEAKKNGLTVIEMNSQGNPVTKTSQYVTIMKTASNEIKSIAGQLGLSIDSRMRILTPDQKETTKDPFAEMLDDNE